MASDDATSARRRFSNPLPGIGGRAAASALRPVTDAFEGALRIGLSVERRAVDRVLESGELERVTTNLLDDARVQLALRRALGSDGAKRLVDGLFDSGLLDRFLERLAASDALWRLVDEIAQSPSVRAALSQQGLGFADQIGGAARDRSRRADQRVARAAARLRQHTDNGAATDTREP
jgi:hypothetical protein